MKKLGQKLGEVLVGKQCHEYGLSFWQCPQFLFLVMGIVIITAIVMVNILARQFVSQEIVSLIVLSVSAVLFVINYIIVSTFDRLAKSAKSKSDFISIMSHRLRAPLSAIKWQIDLLFDQGDDLKGETKHDLMEVKNQNEKMINIINGLLDLNNLEDGTLTLFPVKFSLKKVVEDTVIMKQKEAAINSQTISSNIGEDSFDVYADQAKIKNIVYSLIDNAIRYSARKGNITVLLEKVDGMARFLVSDEGVGVSLKDETTIFTKFIRPDNALRYHIEGTGANLYVARAIVEKSEGKVGFSGIEGKGSTFWFTLPLSKA